MVGQIKFPPPPWELLLDLGSDILDKHPGSATLVPVVGFNVFATIFFFCFESFFGILNNYRKFCGQLEFNYLFNCPTRESQGCRSGSGIHCFFELDLVSGLGKNPDPGSVAVKIHNFFVADPDPGSGAFLTQVGTRYLVGTVVSVMPFVETSVGDT